MDGNIHRYASTGPHQPREHGTTFVSVSTISANGSHTGTAGVPETSTRTVMSYHQVIPNIMIRVIMPIAM